MAFVGELLGGLSYACMSLGSLISLILDTNFIVFSTLFNTVLNIIYVTTSVLKTIVGALLLAAKDFREFLDEIYGGILAICELLQKTIQGLIYILSLSSDTSHDVVFSIGTTLHIISTSFLDILKYIFSSLNLFAHLSGRSLLMVLQFVPWTIGFLGTCILEGTTFILRSFVIGCNNTTATIINTGKSAATITKEKIYSIPRDAYIGLLIIFSIFILHRFFKRELKIVFRTLKSFSRRSLKTTMKSCKYVYSFLLQRLRNLNAYSLLILQRIRNLLVNNSGIEDEDESERDSIDEVESEDEPERQGPSTSSSVLKTLKRQLEEQKGAQTCIICLEQRKNIIFLPCRHMCACHDCCRTLVYRRAPCPLCRQIIRNTITVYS